MTRNVTNLGDELAQHGGVQRVVIRLLKPAPHAMTGFRAATPQATQPLASPQLPFNPSNSPSVAPKLPLPHPPMIWLLWGLPRLRHLSPAPWAAGPPLTSCPVMSRLRAPAFCSSRSAESNRSWERPTVAMAPMVPTCSGSTKGVTSKGRTMGLPSRKRTAWGCGGRGGKSSRASVGRWLHQRTRAPTHHPPQDATCRPASLLSLCAMLPPGMPFQLLSRQLPCSLRNLPGHRGLRRQQTPSSGLTGRHLH